MKRKHVISIILYSVGSIILDRGEKYTTLLSSAVKELCVCILFSVSYFQCELFILKVRRSSLRIAGCYAIWPKRTSIPLFGYRSLFSFLPPLPLALLPSRPPPFHLFIHFFHQRFPSSFLPSCMFFLSAFLSFFLPLFPSFWLHSFSSSFPSSLPLWFSPQCTSLVGFPMIVGVCMCLQ